MSNSKRFARRSFVLGAASAGLSASLPPCASAASRTAQEGLARRLEVLAEDGFDPRHYDLPGAALMSRAEAALRDLVLGRVAALPGRVDIRRDAARADFPAWRDRFYASADPASVLDQAAALHPDAAPIKAELARLRAIAARGGWPAIEGNLASTLEPGSHDAARVAQLRARLAVLDPEVLRGVAAESPSYDARLEAAVRRFQAAEGLEADGRIGRLTWAALNAPVEARIGQLRVALDMRRGLAAPPERRIEVNIPHFRLKLTDAGRLVQDMVVVVGRVDRQTPTLDVRLVAVQFNPPWGVPDRNAREDLLPRFRREPGRMQALGYRLYQRIDGELTEIDATTVDFSAYSKDRFPFIIRQDPGEANALGRIKFVMPNRDDIFMHDTPDRHLFRRPERAFSSGCIRLERPMDLLAEAFNGMPAWNQERIDRALEGGVTQGVSLTRAIPVRLHYDTVMVEAGSVVMRRDIYGLDAAYLRALDAPRSERLAEASPRQ
jgi:murein L,D-transpeptidase YcbB/YkuD